MKIFQIFHSRIQKHGSFEDFMIELARQAHQKEIDLSFVFPKIETPAVKDELEKNSAHVHAISEDWSSWAYSRKLLSLLSQDKPDVVDFHFCSSINFTLIFILLRLRGVRVVFHYHGEIMPIEQLKFVNRHFSKLRLLLFFADSIICVSEANKRFLEALHVRTPIQVVYNGIRLENFEEVRPKMDFRQEMGWESGELVVTSIGSLIPRKGMDILIRAARKVIAEIPLARFVIVGGGDQAKYKALIKELALEEKVVLTGLVKEYPFDILLATDVYASASYAESFGLSIAEAEILGIPVVATRVGGVPEVVAEGKTGLLVDSGNDEQLAGALSLLLSDPALRRQFGQDGKKWVKERFDLKEKVSELIDALVGKDR